MDNEELPTSIYDVTCRTEGCENADITIRVPADPVTPFVVCGACSTTIGDVVLVEGDNDD